MTVHALLSAGGSPGVTTAALALALTWPGDEPVLVAECDPSGGDVMPGHRAGHMTAPAGVAAAAAEAAQGPGAVTAAMRRHLTSLDEQGRCQLLDGITDPRQAPLLSPAWPAIAEAMAGWPGDVIADCGRLDARTGPLPVLRAAATVTMVLRPTLRQVARAGPRIRMLGELDVRGWPAVLLVIGQGHYSPQEIARRLDGDVTALLPDDPKTARVLSDGEGSRRRLERRKLMHAARTVGHRLQALPPGRAHAGRPAARAATGTPP